MSKLFCALIKSNNIIYLKCDSKGSVLSRNTLEEYLDDYENLYLSNHLRSTEASMSACINNISFQPKIIETSEADLVENIIELGVSRICHVTNISGGFYGLTTRKNIEKFYDAGVSPKLDKRI